MIKAYSGILKKVWCQFTYLDPCQIDHLSNPGPVNHFCQKSLKLRFNFRKYKGTLSKNTKVTFLKYDYHAEITKDTLVKYDDCCAEITKKTIKKYKDITKKLRRRKLWNKKKLHRNYKWDDWCTKKLRRRELWYTKILRKIYEGRNIKYDLTKLLRRKNNENERHK